MALKFQVYADQTMMSWILQSPPPGHRTEMENGVITITDPDGRIAFRATATGDPGWFRVETDPEICRMNLEMIGIDELLVRGHRTW